MLEGLIALGWLRQVEEGGTNWSGNAGQTDAFNCLTLFREVVSSDAEGAFIFEEAVNTVTKHRRVCSLLASCCGVPE